MTKKVCVLYGVFLGVVGGGLVTSYLKAIFVSGHFVAGHVAQAVFTHERIRVMSGTVVRYLANIPTLIEPHPNQQN